MSCQKNYDASEQSTALSAQIGTVPLDVATNIAKNFFNMYYEDVDNKLIDNQLTADENGVPLFYLFNYKDGGFLIVSAEYGDMPILANDVNNVFPAKGEEINAGLGMWLIETRDRIKAIRAGKEQPTKMAAALWKDLKDETYKPKFKNVSIDDIRRNANKAQLRFDEEIYNSCDVPYVHTQVGPFMTTRWGQGCGYNAHVPADHLGQCGHAPTGCVATAMAQIIRFHSFPTGYNFSAMPDVVPPHNSGSPDVASLMAQCGYAVGMDYSTDESGTRTQRVEGALQDWGYSNDANYGDYNATTHKDNLNAGRPVILRGCRDYSCFFSLWCWGSDGCHAWVSDGYQQSYHPCYGLTTLWHMNWGWDPFNNNGFFYGNSATSTKNYQYDKGILYDIHP